MWYGFFRLLTVIILKTFFRLKVEGRENIPQKTNFIVVANHSSYLDPFIVGAAIPRQIYWIALRDLYKAFLVKWFMQRTYTLPMGRSSEKLIQLLMKDKNVGLFPEGTRTYDGKLREFKRGAALLAKKTGRPVVPCAIIGAYEAFPRSAKFPKFIPITVKIGKPQYLLKEFDEVIDDIYLQEGTFRIRKSVEEMMYA